jgi:hypothetical protein
MGYIAVIIQNSAQFTAQKTPSFVTIPTAVLNFQFLVASWTSNIHFTLQALRWGKSLGLLSSVNVTAKDVAKF